MHDGTPGRKPPLRFILLIFALSIPFWVAGAVAARYPKALPIDLPVSALMAVCPLVAALILTHREHRPGGVKNLLKRAFDCRRIRKKTWYVPIVLLMPAIMVLSYGLMRLLGRPLPQPHIPLGVIPIFFIAFFIGAAGEELGWSGYILDPMQRRWGALQAGLLLGSVWAAWHVVPWAQARPDPMWIAG